MAIAVIGANPTIRVAVAVPEPSDRALTVVAPALRPFATPLETIVATVGSLLCQLSHGVSSMSLPSLRETIAMNCCVWSMAMAAVAGTISKLTSSRGLTLTVV